MSSNRINKLIQKSKGKYLRPPRDRELVLSALRSIGLGEHDQIKSFFLAYNLSGVSSGKLFELLDLISPTRQIESATLFGKDTYEIQEDYICLTSGEGEGFILYSIDNREIYDVDIKDLDKLEKGEVTSRWKSFNELIEWYLDSTLQD